MQENLKIKRDELFVLDELLPRLLLSICISLQLTAASKCQKILIQNSKRWLILEIWELNLGVGFSF